MNHRSMIGFGVVVALTLAFPVAGGAGKDQNKLPNEAFVQFAHLVTPAPGPNTLAGALTHFLTPDDVRIRKGGTVTFIVNNGGHGIAIHEVSLETTRSDIAEDLCQGGTNEADRAGRFAVCNNTIVTGAITGTQNLAYQITDGEGTLVVDVPQNNNNNNPRVDDANSSERLLATAGRSKACTGQAPPDCDPSVFGGNPAGGFLTGSVLAIPTATPPVAAAVGERIRVTFNKNGRYLVICMNRTHLLNDHMFGFVNVGNGNNDDGDGQGAASRR